ncbi:MAG: (2Fe-2S)-binding protein [Candidatus Izimaplasma sp.]|nr:(2Fe-2S)-binding protein [Candidatus Izimaplasma bacterium]
MNEKDIIVCRCSDISLYDLKKLMEQGYTSFVELKQIARIGMGPCQGRTCSLLVLKELAKFLDVPFETLTPPTVRPTMSALKLKMIAKGKNNEEQR